MPDQDSLTKDPTQKLPPLCRCGCTDHSSVQRCCQANEYLCSPMCSPRWPPPCSPCVHAWLRPCVSVHPCDTSRYKSAQPQRAGEEWVRKGAHNSWTCHAVPSCTECFEQGWRSWVDLYGVLWSVMARRWCSWCLAPGCKLPFVGGGLCLPCSLNIRPWAPSP